MMSEKLHAVVIYRIGAPSQSALYFSPPLAAAASEAEQRRALQSAIIQATGKDDAESQLEAFLTQMSIRLYWMERMMDDGMVEPETAIDIKPADPDPNRFQFPQLSLSPEIIPWCAGGGILALAIPLVWWVKRTRATYRFPEFDSDPRMGGPHAAGVGAVISYLSAKVPPAAQRESMMNLDDVS